MLIISRNKISRIKRELEDKKGKLEYSKFIVKAQNGLFLFDMNLEVSLYNDKFKKIDKELYGYIAYDCSAYLLEDILIVGDGRSEPVFIIEDMPYADKLKEG